MFAQMQSPVNAACRRGAVVAAFTAIYLIWGSTYLAIAWGVETIPPLLMMGVRFLVAGGALYGWACWREATTPLRAHWRSAVVTGALLFL
jgi:drug/metabolite transporter (DMT)-like permease